MAWEIGPFFMREGASARFSFGWNNGRYRGVQMVHAKPESQGEGGRFIIVGADTEIAVTGHTVTYLQTEDRYRYAVDLTAERGSWFQYQLRGNRVD
ncbi:MAG: hypothetical protein AAFZ87_14740 [Planctomycetota bacterium]